MKKILLTGSDGFFGSRFVQYYNNTYQLICCNHTNLEITDEKNILSIFQKTQPEYVLHAAALSNTGYCENNSAHSYEVNVLGSENIALACKSVGAKLIYFSSDQVYSGNTFDGFYTEATDLTPKNVYGSHKLEAENRISSLLDNAVLLRLTWMFDMPTRILKTNSNIIWNILQALVKNQSLSFPIHEERGLTYVWELVENFHKLLELPTGAYNVGSENNLNTYETAKIVFKAMGAEHRINELLIPDKNRFLDEPRNLKISNQKLSLAGISFDTTEKALERCLHDFSFGY